MPTFQSEVKTLIDESVRLHARMVSIASKLVAWGELAPPVMLSEKKDSNVKETY